MVIWHSKKQTVVARSSVEAKYTAMSHGVCELLWLKMFMREIGIEGKGPLMLYCDNKAEINIGHNLV